MRSVEEIEEFASDWLALNGMCLSRPFDDRAARRHLPVTLGDELHAPLVRCHCPGVYGPEFKLHRCFLRATQEDAICDECRAQCRISTGPKKEGRYQLVKAIDYYGPAEGT